MIGVQAVILLFLLSLDVQRLEFVRSFVMQHQVEMILFKFLVELIVLRNLMKFSLPRQIHRLYGALPTIFYMLCSNYKHMYTLVLIQCIYLKLYDWLWIIFLLITCSISFIFLYAKLLSLAHVVQLSRWLLFGLYIILGFRVCQKLLYIIDIEWKLRTENVVTLVVLIIAAACWMAGSRRLLQKLKATNRTLQPRHLHRYMQTLMVSVVLLAASVALEPLFELVQLISFPLVLLFYLVTALILKMRFIGFLTVETYGYFLFYIKSLDEQQQQHVLRHLQHNHYLLLLPVLSLHVIFLLLNQGYIYAVILCVLYVLDIKLDELIMYMTRKVLHKAELPNLFLHSKKGLSTVILIAAIPVALISFSIKTQQAPSFFIEVNILVVLCLLGICIYFVSKMWQREFFREVYK